MRVPISTRNVHTFILIDCISFLLPRKHESTMVNSNITVLGFKFICLRTPSVCGYCTVVCLKFEVDNTNEK